MIEIKSPSEVAIMREGGALLAGLMLELGKQIRPGVTSASLDGFAEQYIRAGGGRPSFKGYRDYPATLCVSRNEVIVHGIPSQSMVLCEGDIVGVDVGAYLKGFHTDMSVTFPVGRVSDGAAKLMKAARESLYEGIEASRQGNRVSDLSAAIGRRIDRDGFSAVRVFVGHGIGRKLHEDPQIANYGAPGRGPKLKAGMVMAIEPMVNEGTWDVVIDDDGWTARTGDGKLSAHFEHTVAVGEDGPEILTVTADGTDPILSLQ